MSRRREEDGAGNARIVKLVTMVNVNIVLTLNLKEVV